jgi:hypothetical protein
MKTGSKRRLLKYHLCCFLHEGLKVIRVRHVQLPKGNLAAPVGVEKCLGLLQHVKSAVRGDDARGAIVCEPARAKAVSCGQVQGSAAWFAEIGAEETPERGLLEALPVFVAVLADACVPKRCVVFPEGDGFLAEMRG